MDVSCDEGMGFEWARPTTFDEPMFTVGGAVDYYAVDHSPSYLWNSATWENSEALLPFLPVVMDGPEAWEADETMRRAIEIRDGHVVNPAILEFQGRRAEHPHALVGSELAHHPGVGQQRRGCPASSSGRVLVCPMIGMKFWSPSQRGTTCWCRCAAIPAPATGALVHADVEALRPPRPARSVRIACWVSAAISAASASVARCSRRRAGTGRPSGARGCRGRG